MIDFETVILKELRARRSRGDGWTSIHHLREHALGGKSGEIVPVVLRLFKRGLVECRGGSMNLDANGQFQTRVAEMPASPRTTEPAQTPPHAPTPGDSQ